MGLLVNLIRIAKSHHGAAPVANASLEAPVIKGQNCQETFVIMALSVLAAAAHQKKRYVAHFGRVLKLAKQMLIVLISAALLDIAALKMCVMGEKLWVICARKMVNVRV